MDEITVCISMKTLLLLVLIEMLLFQDDNDGSELILIRNYNISVCRWWRYHQILFIDHQKYGGVFSHQRDDDEGKNGFLRMSS